MTSRQTLAGLAAATLLIVAGDRLGNAAEPYVLPTAPAPAGSEAERALRTFADFLARYYAIHPEAPRLVVGAPVRAEPRAGGHVGVTFTQPCLAWQDGAKACSDDVVLDLLPRGTGYAFEFAPRGPFKAQFT